MSVWKGADRILWTCLHQGWTEAIAWQSKSNQRMWSTWEQRGSAKFPWNGRLPGQLHQELCHHSSTAVPANQKRNKVPLGKTRGSCIQEDTRQHLKWEDYGILRPKQAHNPPYRGQLQWRPISSPAPKDRQRHTTGTFHQPDNDRDWEEVQSNRERCFSNQMGQGEIENLPTWSTQIQNRDCSQATDTFVQQSKG